MVFLGPWQYKQAHQADILRGIVVPVRPTLDLIALHEVYTMFPDDIGECAVQPRVSKTHKLIAPITFQCIHCFRVR